MSDLASQKDLTDAYNYGLKGGRNELSVNSLVGEFKWPASRASTVVRMLVQKQLASPFREVPGRDPFVTLRELIVARKLQEIKDIEMRLTFAAVETFGSAGGSTREITLTVNKMLQRFAKPPMAKLSTCLRTLENHELIKAAASIHQKGRKIYIVASLEPDASVVGGLFYKNGEFDEELVASYRERIVTFLSAHPNSPLKSVVDYIKASGFQQNLGDSELELIFHSLALDDTITVALNQQTGDFFYSLAKWPSLESLERLPCSSCPHQLACHIEDIDRFDSLLLNQPLIRGNDTSTNDTANGDRLTNLSDRSNHGSNAPRFKSGGGTAGHETAAHAAVRMVTENVSLSASLERFTSKVTPATCPYFSQWLGLDFEPCVQNPDAAAPETNVDT